MATDPHRSPAGLDQKTPTSQRHQIQPREGSELVYRGADLGPGLGRDFPLRLEMVLDPGAERDPESSGAPFIILSDTGRNSRVYLGRIASGHHSSSVYVAIKMQTPRPSHDASEDEGGLLTHHVREKRWMRELRHYLSISGVESSFSPLYFVESAPERSDQSDTPRPWPPLLLCSERQLLFQPVNERGSPLATCRDDELLTSRGLAPYTESVETYLYNRAEVEAGGEASLYQGPGDPGSQPHPNATTFEDCLQAMSQVPGMPAGGPPAMNAPEDVESFAKSVTSFPCLTCAERESCYGERLFMQRLTPFAFEDTNALVVEMNDFHYDEFCDLLGGIGAREFEKEYTGAGAGAGQQFRLRNAESLIQLGRRFMFGSDGSGMDALEVFKLKWTLFTQACQSIFEYHRRCGVAHLRTEPRHVMIKLDSIGDYLPTMWQFRTRLISLGSMTVETRPEWGETGEILGLPANSNPVYDAEIVRNSSFAIIQRGKFLLTSLEETEQEGRYIVKADIQHDGIGMAWLSSKDRVKVILRHIHGMPDTTFFALLDPEKEFSQRTLSVVSHPMELTRETAESFNRIYGVPVHNVGFALYPLFHVPCDVFSLGMLLFRTLTVNDEQRIGNVSMALEGLKQDLTSMVAVECEEGRESDFWEAVLEGHNRQNVAEVFDRSQVFYGADDRYEDRPNAIPKQIWNEAMMLGFQMITSIEDFSICANHGDFDLRYPAGKMEPVLRQAQQILRKIDAELLSTSRRNAEIRAALESVFMETMV